MELPTEIMLDMDGVGVDFVGGVLKVFRRKMNIIELGNPKIEDWLEITAREMWERIDEVENFWENLEPYPWFMELYEGLLEIAPVTFLTKPNLNPNSASGKVRWLQSIFGRRFKDYSLTPNKRIAAKPGVVLVDDLDYNCEEFRLGGGRAVCFPQPWNSQHRLLHHQDSPGFYNLHKMVIDEVRG